MNKLRSLLPLSLLVAVLTLAGCASPWTPTVIRTVVSVGVARGSQDQPQTVPYLRAAGAVVCATAAGTNVSPAQVILALNGTPDVDRLKTPEGLAILNGALGIYQIVWDAIGTNNLAAAKSSLQAVCDGVQLGLPGQDMSIKMRTAPTVR